MRERERETRAGILTRLINNSNKNNSTKKSLFEPIDEFIGEDFFRLAETHKRELSSLNPLHNTSRPRLSFEPKCKPCLL